MTHVPAEAVKNTKNAALLNNDVLIISLNTAKLFCNFKNVIENSGEYRQKGFDFKGKKYSEWVEDQITEYNDWIMDSKM